MVPAHSIKVPRVLMYSGYCCVTSGFMYGAFTLFGRSFQDRSTTVGKSRLQSEPRHARTSVWALTISLAATLVIDFSFSSSGYLDVSVHRVPSVNLWIQLTVHTLRMWVPPFRDLRIFVYVPLPAAFRSLSRLSSALSAKASALCSWCFFSVMTLFQVTTFLD